MDVLISQFIDDELELDEKFEFVKQIHKNDPYFQNTIQLLEQEKGLRNFMMSEPVERPRPLNLKKRSAVLKNAASLVVAVAAVLAFVFMMPVQSENSAGVGLLQHRFVLYQPGVEKIDIAGSFTNWKPVQMKQAGESGYWQVTLKMTPQEHRYSYIINGQKIIADPTGNLMEQDEFGTLNTVFKAYEI